MLRPLWPFISVIGFFFRMIFDLCKQLCLHLSDAASKRIPHAPKASMAGSDPRTIGGVWARQMASEKGVAPGHGTVFAASLSLFRLDRNSPLLLGLEFTAGGTKSGTIIRTCSARDRSARRGLAVLGKTLEETETVG